MTEPKENLMRIRAVRGGNRGVITKLINEAGGLLKEETLQRGRLNTITVLLEEKLALVKELDKKIIEYCEVESIVTEITEAEELISRVLDTQRHIIEKTNEIEEANKVEQNKSPDSVPTNIVNEETVEQQHSEETDQETVETSANTNNSNTNDEEYVLPSQPMTAEPAGTVSIEQNSINLNNNSAPLSTPNRSKLPKLVLPKFRGDVTQWRAFWDSFNSAIHSNSFLTKIDKFNHLNSLLEGHALRAIQGHTLSESNYQAAIDILKQ